MRMMAARLAPLPVRCLSSDARQIAPTPPLPPLAQQLQDPTQTQTLVNPASAHSPTCSTGRSPLASDRSTSHPTRPSRPMRVRAEDMAQARASPPCREAAAEEADAYRPATEGFTRHWHRQRRRPASASAFTTGRSAPPAPRSRPLPPQASRATIMAEMTTTTTRAMKTRRSKCQLPSCPTCCQT